MARIKVSDGAGGEAMQALLKKSVLKYMLDYQGDANVPLAALDDSGVADGLVFTTEANTVRP